MAGSPRPSPSVVFLCFPCGVPRAGARQPSAERCAIRVPSLPFPRRLFVAPSVFSPAFLPSPKSLPTEAPMRHLPFLAAFLLLTAALRADPTPLWPAGEVPGKVTETAETVRDGHVYNVSVPTLECFPAPNPEGRPLPTVLVAPGGGYGCLAYDKEGTEIARWLNALGCNAAVLKYRIPGDREGALADARRALECLRAPAEGWHPDPNRLGMIGFSAGAHLTARVLAQSGHGLAFALLIYPAYLSGDGAALAPETVPAAPTVPTFLAQCGDDRAFVLSSLAYASHLLRANRPVSYRLYASGGHGFGKRRTPPAEAARWPDDAAAWLRATLR